MPAGLLNELTFEPLAEGLQLSFHSSRWEAGECPVVMRYARVSRAERRILLAAVLCVSSRSKSRASWTRRDRSAAARVLSDLISQALFAFGRPRVSRLFDDPSLRLKRSRAKEDDPVPTGFLR